MSNTATTFINLIRKDYPVRGRDNDSQGFRDNFTNISKALEAVNEDVTDLRNTAVLSNTTATFFGNTVEDANFQNCSTELWDNGILGGNITIDYTLGSYQKLTVESSVNNITIINWPDEGKSGHLILSVYPASGSGVYTVNFAGTNITSLGPSKNPYRLLATANVFEIYSEYSAGSEDATVHTRLLNELAQISTSTAEVTTDKINLNNRRVPSEGQGANLTFQVSSSTGALTATIVQTTLVGTSVVANIGLVPNKVVHTIVDIDPTGFVSTNTANRIQFDSVDGILIGAKFNLVNNTSSFTVTGTSVVNNTVDCNPAFTVGIGNGSVIFRNPMFGDVANGLQLGEKTAFPTIVTLLDPDGPEYIPANTSTGRTGVFRGSVYASANTLEVTFKDPDGTKNTFTASTMPATTVTDNTANLANTMFVHMLLPAGAIIMWYGNSTTVPYGWGICDGTTYTDPTSNKTIRSPDLRNKFVIGAEGEFNILFAGTPTTSILSTATAVHTSTGGTKVLNLVEHNHESTGTFSSPPHSHILNDPGHFHTITNQYTGVLAGNGRAQADIDSDDRWTLFGNNELINQVVSKETGITMNSTATEIVANLQTANSGTSAPLVNADNIPPFYALYYIIKWAGA